MPFISESYKSKLQSLAGIQDDTTLMMEGKKEIIINKIGIPAEAATWALGISEKYAIWIANSLMWKSVTEFVPGGKGRHGGMPGSREDIPQRTDVPGESKPQNIQQINQTKKDILSDPKKKQEFEQHIMAMIADESLAASYSHIKDWLEGRGTGAVIERDKLSLKDLTYEAALKRSEAWHEQLEKIGGGRIEDEDGTVVISYPDGWYWIDLGKSYCEKEARAMSHCGRSMGEGDLYSLRKDKEPHLTADVVNKNGERMVIQLRGRANSKPLPKFHPYIVDFITNKKINIDSIDQSSYQKERNFFIHDLDEQKLISKLVYDNPKLFKGESFRDMQLTLDEVKHLIKEVPGVMSTEDMFRMLSFDDMDQLYEEKPETFQNNVRIRYRHGKYEGLKDIELENAKFVPGGIEIYINEGWGYFRLNSLFEEDREAELPQNLNNKKKALIGFLGKPKEDTDGKLTFQVSYEAFWEYIKDDEAIKKPKEYYYGPSKLIDPLMVFWHELFEKGELLKL